VNNQTEIYAINRHRFEIDGKGIRTLIVLGNCLLRCKYCINAFTWDGTTHGKLYTPEELYEVVSVDSVYFYATKGGLTFGGGEPLLHSDFISNFMDIAPKEWSFIVETSLAVPQENISLIANRIDTFIVDIKSMDPDIYRKYTCGDLDLVKSNLSYLLESLGPERIRVRVPTIPGYADISSQERSISVLRDIGIRNIEAFKYKVSQKKL